jgi:CheY-like chemotaxis protein
MSGLRVLIFEADVAYGEELRRAFARRGADVRLFHDGIDAVEVAQELDPSLIVLAIELPNRNGLAICTIIKRHPTLKDVPLVLLSSSTPQETLEQHAKLRTHAEDYVHKPISAESLAARCARLVPLGSAGLEDGVIEVSDDAIVEEVPSGGVAGRDSDLSGLTDAAFDHIMLGSENPADPGEGLPPVPDDFEDFTTVSSIALLQLPPDILAPSPRPSVQAPARPSVQASKPSAPPPVPRHPAPIHGASLPPPPSPAVLAELDALRARALELGDAVSSAQHEAQHARAQHDEAQRLRAEAELALRNAQREVEELRARARPQASSSTREFLELREAMNRKDKEILNLRDQINQRDREMLELRDKILQQDLGRADLDERIEDREREIAALLDQVATLRAAVSEGQQRADALAAELSAARDTAAREALGAASALAAVRAEREAEARAAREAAEAVAAAHASALHAADDAREAALRDLRAEHAEALAAAAEDAREAQESALDTALDDARCLDPAFVERLLPRFQAAILKALGES